MMRDLRTEQRLQRKGYAFQFIKGYDLARINLTAEAQNPARLARRKDADQITKMALDMLDGQDFPAIVVFHNDDQYDSLVTGYHRLCAADEATIKQLDAYVVMEHSMLRRILLPRSINNIEGRSPTLAENLAQCAEVLRLKPDEITQAELAQEFSLKPAVISDYLKLIEQEERAMRLGVDDVWAKIPQATLRRALGRIGNDHVFAMAASTVEKMRLVGKPAEELIDAARRARTEAAATRVLQDALRNHIDVQERAKAKFSKRQKPMTGSKWFAALTRLWRVLPVWDLQKLHLDAIDPTAITLNLLKLKEVRAQIDDVIADQEKRLKQNEREMAWRRRPPGGDESSADISPET